MSGRRWRQWADEVAARALGGLDGEDDPLAWMDRALCAEIGGDLHFPEKGGSTREPKKVCMACEVRSECLDYALERDLWFGIYGGLSPKERRRLRREIGEAA